MRSAMILVSMFAAGAAGCVSSEMAEQREQEAQYARATPLAFDPTEQHELASWWTNGDQLLNLDASGSYKLYEGTNRFHRPAERGRWWQQSYATLWLEPYHERSRESARIAIRKVAGHLVLDVRDLKAMSQLPAPPVVMEDRLTGDWAGAAGELVLAGDLRTALYPLAKRPKVVSFVAGLGGREVNIDNVITMAGMVSDAAGGGATSDRETYWIGVRE